MVTSECSHVTSDTQPFALDPATTPGSAAFTFKNQPLPSAIQVDETHNRLLARRIGVGVQVYDYHSAEAKWVNREPEADLYDIRTGIQRGIHFAGPHWADADGSRVKGTSPVAVDAPVDPARNVKWVRLEAAERFGSAKTLFAHVTFIQRVFTYGGQAPANLTPADGDTVSVPYTALYVFWTGKGQ
jgi:hypothetical protein